MREAGLAPRLIPIEKGLPREEQGRRATAALLASGTPFDAIFGVCDEIAIGAMQILREAGMNVPNQIGVIGFDGTRAGTHITPQLSSIEPDFQAAGTIMVDRLMAAITGKTGEKERVPVRLLARGSSGRSV